MTKNEKQVIQELANALQIAAPLTATLRQDAIALDAAVGRAIAALKRLQPQTGVRP